jgi:transcriptional regulator with XRE-family HTH domain
MNDESIETQIGIRLKSLRKARRVTLDNLASQTGFTKGYLSKIENNKKLPPIETLSKIAKALNSDISYFFQRDENTDLPHDAYSVVREGERKNVVRGGSSFGYDYESLAYKKITKSLEPFIFTFPEELTTDSFFSHEGEEMVFVLNGKVEFEIEGTKVLLSPGDCLYMDSIMRHRGRAVDGEAKALVVIYQPS